MDKKLEQNTKYNIKVFLPDYTKFFIILFRKSGYTFNKSDRMLNLIPDIWKKLDIQPDIWSIISVVFVVLEAAKIVLFFSGMATEKKKLFETLFKLFKY